ncbi:M6 family metalloprotease domain-containing protein, partial [candidate division KSB1 bacterium]|nr:M6 family metalloprotease domain-containing protein [candidate division KSB1 bacterium]
GSYSNSSSTFDVEDFQALLFDGPNPTGTMTDYYEKISYGSFTLDGDVFGWYQAPGTQSFYANRESGLAGGAPQFVMDLAILADSEVDFGKYDNDGPDGIPNSGDDDGTVDALVIVHTGGGAEAGDSDNIWSHRWSLSGGGVGVYTTNDPRANGGRIRINDYIIQPELSGDGTQNDLIEIGVFCHEFGHALGLPDLYDTDDPPAETSEGVGNWCLMGGGSYGGDGRHSGKPVHMSAWCKEALGWIIPVVVDANYQDLQFPQVESDVPPVVYKIWRNGNVDSYLSRFGADLPLGREYFLVENRQKTGFDEYIYSGGLLIWHVDNSRISNRDELHKLVDLEAADGMRHLDDGYNRGDIGDPFPGGMNNTAFDEFSNPNSLDYNENPTQVAVWNISQPDSVMTANVEVFYGRPYLAVGITNVEDVDGNLNGRAEAGETAALSIRLGNEWAELSDVTVKISTADSGISFQNDELFLGDLSSKSLVETSAAPFMFGISPQFETHRVYFDLEISGIAAFEPFVENRKISTMIGIPGILLVDDDGGDDFETFIQASLDSLDQPFDDANLEVSTALTKGYSYNTMIWITGKELETALTPAEQDSLRMFLKDGGRLLLTGQNIAENLAQQGSNFLSDVLHVEWAENIADRLLKGVTGDPVSDTLKQIVIAGGDGARNQVSPDNLIPDDTAKVMLRYSKYPETAAAVRVQDVQTNSKIVFMGFGMEGVNSEFPGFATRNQLLANILSWLESDITGVQKIAREPVVPASNSLDQNYPNPFNPETTIRFSIKEHGFVSLKVYNINGQEITTLVNKELPAGTHRVVLDASQLSTGIYFYQLKVKDFVVRKRMILLK